MGGDVEQLGPSCIDGENVKRYNHFEKQFKKLNRYLPCDPDTLFLDISPREMEARAHTMSTQWTHTRMPTAVLFVIVKI